MKKIISKIAVIFLLSFCVCNANQTTEKFNKYIANIKSLKANFVQTSYDGQGGNDETKGKIFLKKPFFFKWKTDSQVITSNGKKIWQYDSDLEQVIIKKISNDISNMPFLVLLPKYSKSVSKFFNMKKDDNRFILKPKGEDSLVRRISIDFNKDGAPSYIDISTTTHQFTQITFTDISVNNNDIADKLFKPSYPKGIDTIDETKTN